MISMMKWVRYLDGSSVEKWATTWWVEERVKSFILNMYPTILLSFSLFLGIGMNQSSRLSSSVSAMRVLNTGSDVEEALADALVWKPPHIHTETARNTYQLCAHPILLSHMQDTPPGVCASMLTNPQFYLCLMLSAVGRHPVQGQVFLLPLTCVVCLVVFVIHQCMFSFSSYTLYYFCFNSV